MQIDKKPNHIKKLAQYTIVVLLLGLIGKYFIEHTEELKTIADISVWNLLLLFSLLFINNILYAYSMYVILEKRLQGRLTAFEWIKIVIVSRAINFFVTQGANVYRSIYLKQKFDLSHANYIGVVMFHSWWFTVTTLSFCWLAFWCFNTSFAMQNAVTMSLFAIAILLLGLLPVLVAITSRFDLFAGKRFAWIKERASAILIEFNNSALDKLFLFRISCLSFITFLITIVTLNITFEALHHELSIDETSLFATIFTMSKYMNVVPGNLGVTEYLFGLLSHLTGGTLGVGVLVSGILRVIDFLVIGALSCALAIGMLLTGNTFNHVKLNIEPDAQKETDDLPK